MNIHFLLSIGKQNHLWSKWKAFTVFLHRATKAHSYTPSSFSPSSVFTNNSQNILKSLVKAKLSEGADRLESGFPHRVPQLPQQHPEKQQHQSQESEEHPHVQAQVPTPAHGQRQRGGRHLKPLGHRHGGGQKPDFATSRTLLSFNLDLLGC